ncbi:MAG: hypothetical protein RMM31_11075 [Anaerolineae bacterium]|nr:hypothetical protein [Thermoflexales bacterium]MDW8396772.1 hypothetical protein [Anaerolineae bacterium]
MDIQHLLSRLENILLEARRIPGTKYKLVDAERCFQIIDQMVLAIPDELKKAQRVQQEYERMIAQAQQEAERIKAEAREEAERLAETSSILSIAQARAQSIEERARREGERLRADAEQYAAETLFRLRNEIEHLLAVIDNGITKLDRDRAERLELLRQSENGLLPEGNPTRETRP